MDKKTLKSPSGVVYSTRDMETARLLKAQGWKEVEAVITTAKAKKS